MRRWLGLAVVAVVVMLLGAACSSSSDSGDEGGSQITIAGDKANDHGSKDASGMKSIEVEADNFYFEPTTLTGTAGQTLEIEISKSATVAVRFPSSGVVEFYCKYHKSRGMVGQLKAS